MNIIGKKFIFLSFSTILVVVSIVLISTYGLKRGIDFTGGSLLEVEFQSVRPDQVDIRSVLEAEHITSPVIQPTGERAVIIRFGSISEEEHQKILTALAAKSGGTVTEKRFDSIGPVIGSEFEKRSLIAILLTMGAIVLYIAWAFRHVSRPVSSWKYGIVTLFALIHDVLIPAGFFALLGHFYGVEIDALFITALLTIMGFSVHDTIVVFDRTRENLRILKGSEPFAETVNRSLNQTLTRSINTSLTVLIVLLCIYFFGGETTRHFTLALFVGILFGTYSSIFVASPLLVVWQEFEAKRKSRSAF